MKDTRPIVLLWIIGCFCLFTSCNGNAAKTVLSQGTNYIVQAFGMVDELDISIFARVVDQEQHLSSDAMLTVNGEPMNIGFFPAEAFNMNQADNTPADIANNVQAEPTGDYEPYYFLDSFHLSQGDTVNFAARGSGGFTLYSGSSVVPKKITLIEPPPDAIFLPGQEVHVKWEGGEPFTCFEVVYVQADGEDTYPSGLLEGQQEYTIPAGVIQEGDVVIAVSGFECTQYRNSIEAPNFSGFYLAVSDMGLWVESKVTDADDNLRRYVPEAE